MGNQTSNRAIAKRRSASFSKCYASAFNCYVERAKGALIWDVEGKEYIDFAGGIGGMNVGHSHPKVVAALKDQVERFTHTCLMVAPYESAVSLAERICALMPGEFEKAAAFVTTGAEAVENAVKISRGHTKRSGVVVLGNAYHGRTMLTMAMTGKVMPFKAGFGPLAHEVYKIGTPYCYRCPIGLKHPECGAACAELLEELFIKEVASEEVACVVVEPVLGEGGFIVPPFDYFAKLKAISQKYGIVFVSDEIQAGMGRTGKYFAIEHYGVEPDLITTAKSLAAGVPIAAVIGKREIMDSVHPSGVGGTYSGNPLGCAAGLAVLDILESENLNEASMRIGRKTLERFQEFKRKYPLVGDVRGLGGMVCMELVSDRERKTPAAAQAKKLSAYCFEKGLLALATGTYSNVIRMLAPLVISDEQLERGLQILEEGLSELGD
jgi:4-aminobutyrate aminotransferase/(S)-3-amino-2-methylpropionate transaminase